MTTVLTTIDKINIDYVERQTNGYGKVESSLVRYRSWDGKKTETKGS